MGEVKACKKKKNYLWQKTQDSLKLKQPTSHSVHLKPVVLTAGSVQCAANAIVTGCGI